MKKTCSAAYVLLADDDADDIEIVTNALNELEEPPSVVVVENGKRVLEHLQHELAHSGSTPACALIMDMNMPHMDGRETVVAIKKNNALKNLPILLFSTSRNRADEMFAQKWGVQFVEKPGTVESVGALARRIASICSIGSNSSIS